MSVTATSRVATERGERYRKQLASHFGNKIDVVEEPGGTVLTWGFGGSTTLTVEDDALVMRADAEDAETLERVKDVTGRHRLEPSPRETPRPSRPALRHAMSGPRPAAMCLDDDLARQGQGGERLVAR